MGWDVNVHVNLRQDVNVHVNLRQQLMLRTRGDGGVGWDVNVYVNFRRARLAAAVKKQKNKTGLTCFRR